MTSFLLGQDKVAYQKSAS
jgi:hypothetical protein